MSIDIHTKLNIIISNTTKVNVNIPKKLNINIPTNPKKEANTDIPNIIIPRNLKKTSNNVLHESINNIPCNYHQSLNVDILTQLNINIPSNPIKVNVDIPTKLNINKPSNNKKQVNTDIPNIIISTSSKTKPVATYFKNQLTTYHVINVNQLMSTYLHNSISTYLLIPQKVNVDVSTKLSIYTPSNP